MEFIGHERQRNYLNTVLRNNRLAHAYLFSGPLHIGKGTFAKLFAKRLLCERATVDTPLESACQTCSVCISIEKSDHPNVARIEGNDTSEIAIDEIRALRRRFSFKASEDAPQIALIDRAERMSVPAANALLKLLEEPGRNTIFLLTSAYPRMLPQTIISRTQTIPFFLVPEGVMCSALGSGVDQELIALAGGRPGLYYLLKHDEKLRVQYTKLSKQIAQSLARATPDIFLTTASIAEESSLRAPAEHYLFGRARSMLLAHIQEEPMQFERVHRDTRALHAIAQTMHMIKISNANPRWALDAMFAIIH